MRLGSLAGKGGARLLSLEMSFELLSSLDSIAKSVHGSRCVVYVHSNFGLSLLRQGFKKPVSYTFSMDPTHVVVTPVSHEALESMRYPLWSSSCIAASAPMQWCGRCPGVGNGCAWHCYVQRLVSSHYHMMYAVTMIESHDHAPCSWCGRGAGDWCENCDRVLGPASAMCFRCEKSLRACRLCHAANYVRGDGSIHRPPDAARRSHRGGYTIQTCGSCSVNGRFKKCARCRVVSYCGTTCQRRDWPMHKPVCRMLRGAISVNFIYPWQRGSVDTLREWSIAEGGGCFDRFLECFGEVYSGP